MKFFIASVLAATAFAETMDLVNKNSKMYAYDYTTGKSSDYTWSG